MARYENPLPVTRQDAPFIVITLIFLAAIFWAGRYSVKVPEPVAVPVPVAPAPVASQTRILVVTTSAPIEPPMALLPEAPETTPAVTPATRTIAAPKPSTTVAVAPVAPPVVEPIVLEETPENPYRNRLAKRASNNPGF